MSSDINDRLTQFLGLGQSWEKKATNIQGVSDLHSLLIK